MADISTEHLELLYDVSRSLHGLIEISDLLPFVVEKTKELLQAEGCSVILLDETGRELYFPWVSPENSEVAERLRQLRMPADKGIAGAVLQTGKSLLVPDVRADARFYSEVDQQTGGATRSIVCAPLRTQRGIIGVIECINRRDGSFADSDLTFLEALAGSIAVAIENARLYQTLKLSEARLRDEVALLARERPAMQRFTDIVGSGQAMEKVFRLVESALGSPITRAVAGRNGQRQGDHRARHPFPRPTQGPAVRGGELRRVHRNTAGERAVRLPQGRVHRREHRQARPLRGRRRRHHLPR